MPIQGVVKDTPLSLSIRVRSGHDGGHLCAGQALTRPLAQTLRAWTGAPLPRGLRTPPPPGTDPLFPRTKGSRQSLRVLLTPHPFPEQDKGVGCKGSDASASFCGGYKGREAG